MTRKAGQSTIEIVAYIVVISLALIALFSYMRKGLMGSYRKAAHSILTD